METWVTNFAKIPLGQRLILLVAMAASVATILVTVLWAQRPDFEPLFGNMAIEDVNQVVNNLRDSGVKYQLSNGGTTVMVPSEKVHELRMRLAEDGLPSGGAVGFEIFDRSNYGTTDYVQKVNFRRALEGELSRTIGSLDQVRSARVHLVIPEKRLFSKDQDVARASVTLKLKNRIPMGDDKVQGILHLVASAVPGLDPEQVTVVDHTGRVLYSGGSKDGKAQQMSTQAGFRYQLEERLMARVMEILAPTVGRERLQVQVAAELDFTRTETTQEQFDPDVSVVRSEQRTKEQHSGSSGGAGGATGVTAQNSGGSGESNQSKNLSETINYELNKTVSHSVSQVGKIKRLSVAVLMDAAALGAEGESATEVDMSPYTTLVKKAIGFDATRGDSVEVVAIPFMTAEVFEALPEPGMMDKVTPFLGPSIRYLMAVLAIGAVIALVLKPLVKVVSSATPPSSVGGQDLVLADGLPKTVGQLESENSALFEDFEVPPEMPASRADVLRMAEDNPRQAAEMLKTWMKDG